ncbi:MAG: hypothetical protein GY856_23125 [bacterium]|nr:hypothetical protein [bacterium]
MAADADPETKVERSRLPLRSGGTATQTEYPTLSTVGVLALVADFGLLALGIRHRRRT